MSRFGLLNWWEEGKEFPRKRLIGGVGGPPPAGRAGERKPERSNDTISIT
jgi:hypothetical protein